MSSEIKVEHFAMSAPITHHPDAQSTVTINIKAGEAVEYKPEGKKFDEQKPMMALIPAEALEAEAAVWSFGAKKYGNFNWCKGLVYTRIISAMLRHTVAVMRGEDLDPESQLPHEAHIRCCAGMLIAFKKWGRVDLDDRYKGENK